MKITFIEANTPASFATCLSDLIAEALFQKMRQEERSNNKNQGENDRVESGQADRVQHGGTYCPGNVESNA